MADCSKCKNSDRCEMWDFERKKITGDCEAYEPIEYAPFDIFEELKRRARAEISILLKSAISTDDPDKRYKYKKIRVGVETMLEHIYQVENEFNTIKPWANPVITNAEKIRSMTDKELTEFLESTEDINQSDWLQWLQSEAE